MNKSNPLYEYNDQLNEYGVKLVRQFMGSEEYRELRLKIAKIDEDLWKAKQEYDRKFRELHDAKRNMYIIEIPKAKDKYVREHIEDYKAYLTQELNNESKT